jgi:hypothetical protein
MGSTDSGLKPFFDSLGLPVGSEKSESEILRTNNEFPLKLRAYLQHCHRDKTTICRPCAPVPLAAPTSRPGEAPRRASARRPRVASRSTMPPPRWRGRAQVRACDNSEIVIHFLLIKVPNFGPR